MPISPLLPVLPVTPSARPAPASNSVPLAPILRPCPSMVSVTIAHTHATLADQLPPSVPLVFLDSTSLGLPVSLPAPPEPAPLTASANALRDSSIPTSVCLHAPLASVPLEDSALSVLTTVLPAPEPPLPVPAV
jgi:hypothetical protein